MHLGPIPLHPCSASLHTSRNKDSAGVWVAPNEKAQHCLPHLDPLIHQEHNSNSPVWLSPIFPPRTQVPTSRMTQAGILPPCSVNLRASPSWHQTGNVSQRDQGLLGSHTSEATLSPMNVKNHSCFGGLDRPNPQALRTMEHLFL